MDYLPICLNIKSKDTKVLVVGGGKVCEHKLKAILKFVAKERVTVLAQNVSAIVRAKGVNIVEKSFEENDVVGYKIIYACTNSKRVNREVFIAGNNNQALVNSADDPSLSNFVSPAVEVVDPDLVIAVSTDAKNVKKGLKYREKIVKYLSSLGKSFL